MPKEQIYTQLINFPGIPIESVNSAVGLLLNVHGVKHHLSVQNVDEGNFEQSLITGDKGSDLRSASQYMELNAFLSDLSREYPIIDCEAKSNGLCLHLQFTCK